MLGEIIELAWIILESKNLANMNSDMSYIELNDKFTLWI